MTPNDLVMHSASAQSILWIDKSFCSLEIRNLVSSIYSYFTSLETAIYSSHSDERLADEHMGINGNQWIMCTATMWLWWRAKHTSRDVLLTESKRWRWEHQASWDILDLNNKRQYHHSEGDFQSDWKDALKTEDGLPTISALLFHGGFFLKTWRKHASCGEKRRLLALTSSASLKWWLCSE